MFTQSLSLGPEIYHVHRVREGGTKQSGWVYGVRGTYDRIKGNGLYWGVNGLYAKGPLRGHCPSMPNLHSMFTDKQVEGRIGYSLSWDWQSTPLVTPFLGVGYFNESNQFVDPTPTHLKFKITYPYFAFGFLSSAQINYRFSLGVNFKGYAMYDAKCQVNSPEGDQCAMYVTDEINYRLELPLVYQTCCLNRQLKIGFVPFYEYRHYGGRPNFPFDFLDTRLNIFGLNVQFLYYF